jgi:Uma2 family endonuclease
MHAPFHLVEHEMEADFIGDSCNRLVSAPCKYVHTPAGLTHQRTASGHRRPTMLWSSTGVASMSAIARRWSRAEYDRMVVAGLLHEDEHVQLIEGEILEMTPQYPSHAATIQLLDSTLRQVFGPGAGVRAQVPLALSDDSEPEPDLAVVAGDARAFIDEHPTTALFVVEVADWSLAFDRRKGRIYAAAGIPEYWIVNLAQRALEVYRAPGAVAGSEGFAYAEHATLDARSRVSPVARPGASIAVADLLP